MMQIRYLIFVLAFVLLGCQSGKYENASLSENIRLNQIGYYPNAVKKIVVVHSMAEKFDVLDSNHVKVFSGPLIDSGTWDKSGESCKIGDMSAFTEIGRYTIFVEDLGFSHSFEIKKFLYEDALKASVKSFYYQRCSMPIDERFAGVYARPAGFPDDACKYHPTLRKSRRARLNSPGGWFDAGDYGKYIVNAGISTSMMMYLHELFPKVLPDGSILFPERDNNINDLLDELRYELDWVLTMQDRDGGVFHKLTTLTFQAFVMPDSVKADRYVIGKSTDAALAFAGMCAQAARVYNDVDPEFAATCLKASERAWAWAEKNPNRVFENPEDVNTGPYADNDFEDQFFYAAAQLYCTTGDEIYYSYLKHHDILFTFQPGENWRNYLVNLAYYYMATLPNDFTDRERRAYASRIVEKADELVEQLEANPYRQPLEHFEWGSNSDVLDLSMLFSVAHYLTAEQKYLNASMQTTDYIFGKNALGYSFVTGFGSRTPMNLHHRPSAADGVEAPIPGFLSGGPNKDRQDSNENRDSGVAYSSTLPAKSWMDVVESYASNEVCLNWNAPLTFVLGYYTGLEFMAHLK